MGVNGYTDGRTSGPTDPIDYAAVSEAQKLLKSVRADGNRDDED